MAHPTRASGLQLIRGGRRVRRVPGHHSRVFVPIGAPLGGFEPFARVIRAPGVQLERRRRRRGRSGCLPACWKGLHYLDSRGLHRIFNAAGYRFYRSNSAPPLESAIPFATNATLPHTPDDAYADGTWYVAVSYFNGVIDSGFLPLGGRGETYLRLDLFGGEETAGPPAGPHDVRLERTAGGAVKIWAAYLETGTNRASQWAVAYTDDGSTPPEDAPDVTVAMKSGLWEILEYELPTSGDGKTVKIRVQTRRQDGETWVYSDGSDVHTILSDAAGPDAPEDGQYWPRER